ncbi:HlyD family secretion protein [Tardiphaga alba]|nr:efflux RND transporter periplasmic adaptor subunit [Tardiphaga alba]
MSIRTTRTRTRLGAAVIVLGSVGCVAYSALEQDPVPAPILGVVRETEIHVAAERNGRLANVVVAPGQFVRRGSLLAVLSSPELEDSREDAHAAERQAQAYRNNVNVGVRREEIDISVQGMQIAEANLELARQQYQRSAMLAVHDFASKQKLDEDTTALRKTQAKLDAMKAGLALNQNGATKEERTIAQSKVVLASAVTAAVDAALSKTQLLAPDDGVVKVVVANSGEIVSPGQAVLTMADPLSGRWMSFTIREDRLNGLAIGSKVRAMTARGKQIIGHVAELRPLGEFATWRAARAVGDHDLNSFFVRVEPTILDADVQPGMSIWLVGHSPGDSSNRHVRNAYGLWLRDR